MQFTKHRRCCTTRLRSKVVPTVSTKTASEIRGRLSLSNITYPLLCTIYPLFHIKVTIGDHVSDRLLARYCRLSLLFCLSIYPHVSLFVTMCIMALIVGVQCWKLYRRVPWRGLSFRFFRRYSSRMYRLATNGEKPVAISYGVYAVRSAIAATVELLVKSRLRTYLFSLSLSEHWTLIRVRRGCVAGSMQTTFNSWPTFSPYLHNRV